MSRKLNSYDGIGTWKRNSSKFNTTNVPTNKITTQIKLK